jgi:hypothetical protein
VLSASNKPCILFLLKVVMLDVVANAVNKHFSLSVVLSVVILSVVILSVVILSVVILSVVMPSVVAPFPRTGSFQFWRQICHFFQIYVDWKNTDHSPFVDLPLECADINSYTASLGHKANHSFIPNCQFVAVQHPR